MAETLRFDITGNTSGAQRSARDLAGSMDVAARGARLLADSLDKQKRAAAASVGATLAAAKADKLLADASDEAIAKFAEEKVALDRDRKAKEENALATAGLAKSTKGAAAGASGLVSPMGALVGAGVALAPVIVTVGTGLAGLGLAAAGIVSPILKAAKASGGLQANLGKLDPAQRTVAKSVLQLQQVYDGFQKSLEPVLLADFNAAIGAARPLLKGIQPVAEATGQALAFMFKQVAATFKSGEWQQFFGFMGRTAAEDVRLLGSSFTILLDALPRLLQELQPVAIDILEITNFFSKLVDAGARVQQSTDRTGKHMGALQQITTALRLALFAPGVGLYHALKLIGVIGPDAGKGIKATGDAAAGASYHVGTLAQAVLALNTAESKSLDTQLAYTNSLIAAGDDAQKLRQALKASAGQVGLHTAAQRASFAAANTYISDLETAANAAVASGKGASGAARAISAGLPILEQAARHNHALWTEVQTLKTWLDKLRLEPAIREKILVTGTGNWSTTAALHKIAQGPGPFAAGGRVPGTGTGDTFPALLTPGEVVVPKRMVNAGVVDHLRGSLPGFAAGGIVPAYAGSVAGLQPWAARNVTATNRVIFTSIAASIAHAFASAVASAAAAIGGAGGPGGGAPAANAALARRMMPAWGSGAEWAAWNYVAMRESGWNQFARNPSSGAYGIPQALPPSKMGPAANPPQSNPRAQISWMIGYIRSVYGDPIGAAAHERNFNWYGSGFHGWVNRPTVFGAGERGRERVDITPASHTGGGQKIVLQFQPGSEGQLTRALVDVLTRHVRDAGGGDVQVALGTAY